MRDAHDKRLRDGTPAAAERQRCRVKAPLVLLLATAVIALAFHVAWQVSGLVAHSMYGAFFEQMKKGFSSQLPLLDMQYRLALYLRSFYNRVF